MSFSVLGYELNVLMLICAVGATSALTHGTMGIWCMVPSQVGAYLSSNTPCLLIFPFNF